VVVLKNGDLASASEDKLIIWDATTYQIKRIISDNFGYVWCLAVLSNGDLVTGSSDKTIKTWNTLNGTLKRTFAGHSLSVRSLVVLSNNTLASASSDNTIKIWHTNIGVLIRTLSGHSDEVRSLAVLPNGYLASGGNDGAIKIWNVLTGVLVREFNQIFAVRALTALSNGDLVIPDVGTINIWDTTNGTLKRTIDAHSSFINSFAFFPNGDLASAGDDKIIKIWNPVDWTLKKTLTDNAYYSIYTIVAMNDRLLAGACLTDKVTIWNI
jgi:eukaryotic-like serine/threonine-protein kinase